jgi:hypothetical protein
MGSFVFGIFPLAYRLAAAKRVDAGMMSEEEFRLQLMELNVRLNSEAQRRNVLAQQAYSQRLQSMGVVLQGLGVWQQSLTPPTAVADGPLAGVVPFCCGSSRVGPRSSEALSSLSTRNPQCPNTIPINAL